MPKKLFFFLMTSILMFNTLAATRQQAAESQGLSYLGVLAKGYPDSLVRSQLALAHVDVRAIQDGMIIFSINENSKITRFFNKHLPFLEGVYLDRQAVLKNAKVAKTRIAQEFMALCSRKNGSVGGSRPLTEPDGLRRYFIQGAENISTETLALDKMIARIAFPTADFPKDADDDAFEENDTFATAAAVTPGTYSNLQCFDDDWYKVAVSAGQDLVVSANYDDDLGNLYFDFYDSPENQIGYSYRYEYGHRRGWAANLAAGDYYIYVYGDGDLSYDMTVETGDLLGFIEGNVTDSSTAPLQNVSVNAYDTNWYYLGNDYTDSNGDYTLEAYPGQAYVYFWGQSAGNYISEYYNNKSEIETSDEVTVTANSTITGIDAELADGGTISGRVTDASSGTGLYNLEAFVYDSDYHHTASAYPDSDGYFTAQGLPSGMYRLHFYSWDNHISEWYNDKSSFEKADPVSVTAGSDTPGINIQLVLGGYITGHVQDSYGTVLYNSLVYAFDSAGNDLSYGWTNIYGDYTISQVPAGSVKVWFNASYNGTYVDEWYNDKRSFSSADLVTVASGGTTAGINAVVIEGGTISGRVTNTLGNGIDDVNVRIYDGDANQQSVYANTDSNGYYTISGLYPGSYKVWFDAYYTWEYASEWYDDKDSFDTGDTVAVASGGTTSNIDAVLLAGGEVHGYVNNSYWGGIEGVVVAVYDLNHRLICSFLTESNGYYYVNALPAGSYKIYFDPAYADGQYIAEWYFDKANFDSATPVVVNAGSSIRNATTILSLGKRISITSPTSNSTWFTKSLLPITWSKISTQNANVKIQLYKGTSAVSTISLKTANDGSFDWTIASGLAAATNYRIKITTKDNLLSAFSGYFTIARPSITITAPVAGAVWGKGTAQTITWTKTGTQAATVKIQLFKGTTLKATLAASTGNDGSFDWTVPAGQSTATNYKIKITTTDSAIKVTSSQFTIN